MPDKTLDRLLKHTCQSTGACWAVLLVRANDEWGIEAACGLSKKLRGQVLDFIADFNIHSWLSGALSVGRSRSRSVDALGGPECARLYVFPKKQDGQLLLVGSAEMPIGMQKLWRNFLLQLNSSTQPVSADKAPVVPETIQPAGLALEHLSFLQKVVREMTSFGEAPAACRHISSLLAKYFSCELVSVWSRQGESTPLACVYGEFFPALEALGERLRSRGRSRVIDSLEQAAGGELPPGWENGTALCAPFDPSDPGAGMILIARRKSAFSKSDLIVLELAAGILAGVIANAEQYQSLQNTVVALQETQQELQARIGAQKEAEARLVQAAKLAAVGEMAAGVAHELNNPLTTVVGFTELVMDELPDDMPQKNDLDMVLREARRARMVVRRLLDFARQSETSRASADLNELVGDVVALMRHLLHTTGVTLKLDLQDGLPWTVMDRNQIKQVILNLMHNALNAIPKGSGEITIASQLRHLYERPWLTLSIHDNGVGIPAENIEHIFEPFFTTRSGSGGTGLGLSVTYGIVTDHNGRIEVESQLNVGSTFTVWLPVME